MPAPYFSIITPTFRRPLLLKRNILSVKNQTFEDYEHIIIDDANDPGTPLLIAEFKDKRIVLHQHDYCRGAGASYNTGIKVSHGSLIVFLDDDDEYLPDFLEKMYDRFTHTDQNIGFIWCGVTKLKDTFTGEKINYSMVWPSKFTDKEEGLIAATSIGNGYGVCIKRECFDKIGLFDETIISGQDTDFLFRLARDFYFETIPEILVKIHQHDNPQLSDSNNDIVRLEQREKILQKNSDLLQAYPRLYQVHYKVLADLCYKLKLNRKGRKIVLSLINKNPIHILNVFDLLFYELTGSDSVNFYNGSKLKKYLHLLKRKSNNKYNEQG